MGLIICFNYQYIVLNILQFFKVLTHSIKIQIQKTFFSKWEQVIRTYMHLLLFGYMYTQQWMWIQLYDFFGHFTSRNDCNILPTIIHKQIDEPIGQYSHKKMGRIRSLFDLFLSNVWIEIGPIFMGSPGIWSICLWRT